jgi:predicted secreted protein
MTDSQLGSSESAKAERTSLVRVVLWTTVAVALIVGLVLFFRYTRLMTPLL